MLLLALILFYLISLQMCRNKIKKINIAKPIYFILFYVRRADAVRTRRG